MIGRRKRVEQYRPLEERFWPKVRKTDTCWWWTAGGDKADGYGRIRAGGRGTPTLLAHRAAWEITFGPIPDGLEVCHTCDTPRCVRPDHLFLGTSLQNNQDMVAKGRQAKGERWYQTHPLKRRLNGVIPSVPNGLRARRNKPDPVTAAVRWAVMHRDQKCILARLDEHHECRDRWGEPHRPDDLRRLTVEHVKSDLRMGVRAPSDMSHLLAMCHAGNVGVPSKGQRRAMREHLLGLEERPDPMQLEETA